MVIGEWLKARIVSDVYLAEGVNGSVKTKLLGQGVGSCSRIGVDRFRGEAERRACRSTRACESG